jgi:ketosteroid isomerase-like protein
VRCTTAGLGATSGSPKSCSRRISPGTSPPRRSSPVRATVPRSATRCATSSTSTTNYRVEASEFIDGGDEVVVVARSKGTAKASRMELDQLFAFVWTVQGGRLARLRVFTDREQALEAAGLRE